MPTPKRSLPSIVIKRGNELLLFDCGEGTQARMFKARTGFMKKTRIFITHMHGDHVLGLPGLFQTMSLLGRKQRVDVYGPKGIARYVEVMRDAVKFGLTFDIIVHEINKSGTVHSDPEYTVEAAWADHDQIATLAYAFVERPRPGRFLVRKAREIGVPEGPLWKTLQSGKSIVLRGKTIKPERVLGPSRPGRKIVYTGDTRPFRAEVKFAKGADILIHDSTLDDGLGEKAQEAGHSTPSQAAKIAKEAEAKKLFLFHISPRYKNPKLLLSQAKKIFPNTWVPNDLHTVEVNLRR